MLALADAIAVNQGDSSHLMFRFHRVARRIASRFDPQVARAWMSAVTRFKGGIDENLLRSALAAKDMAQIQAAVGGTEFGRMMRDLEQPLQRTAAAAGTASAQALEANGISIKFNAVHPNVVLYARDQSAALVQKVGDDVREAIRTVVAIGAQEGLTTGQQARAIREVVGLPPNQVRAPFNLEKELRAGDLRATRRRLSATDKAQIRSRIKRGTVTEKFIARMRERYEDSLINRRALNIARTETLRAANFGQQESWMQGMQQGSIPKNSRRFWIVTPDERLSEQHRMIPSMNPNGRRMDEMFQTTEGPRMFPPSRPNCRCGIGLGIAPAGAVAVTAPTQVPPIAAPVAKVAKKAKRVVKKKKMIKKSKAVKTKKPMKTTAPAETVAPTPPPLPPTPPPAPPPAPLPTGTKDPEGVVQAIKSWTAAGGPQSGQFPTTRAQQLALREWIGGGAHEGTVYRGVGYDWDTWANKIFPHLKVGENFPGIPKPPSPSGIPKLASWTKDGERVGSYMRGDIGVRLRIERLTQARDITNWSLYPEEQEILAFDKALRITRFESRPGGQWDVWLEEVKAPPVKPDPFAGALRGRKLDARLLKLQEGLGDELTYEQQFAMHEYQSQQGFRAVQDILRKGSLADDELLADSVAQLDSIMEVAAPLDEQAVFWRSGRLAQVLHEGDIFVDNAYVSTSVDQGLAERFLVSKNRVMMRVVTPKDQRGLYVGHVTEDFDEMEFLLPRGSRFRIVRDRRLTWEEYSNEFQRTKIPQKWRDLLPEGPRIVDVEVVPHEAPKLGARVTKKAAKKKTTKKAAKKEEAWHEPTAEEREWANPYKSLEDDGRVVNPLKEKPPKFETPEEMAKWFSDHGLPMEINAAGEELEMEWMNLHAQRLAEYMRVGKGMPNAVKYEEIKGGLAGAFNPNNGHIQIDVRFYTMKAKKAGRDIIKVYEDNIRAGFWTESGGDPITQVLDHEFGHFYHLGGTRYRIEAIHSWGEYSTLRDWIRPSGWSGPDALRKAIAKEISDYASTIPSEFVAEAFAKMRGGGRLSRGLQEFYNILGGQPWPPVRYEQVIW